MVPRSLRAAVVAAALAACLLGLLGASGGLVMVVAGVWAVRWSWGRPPGAAWGIAVLGAGFRWGTVDVAGVQAATRELGPTVATGPGLVFAGAVLALVAALVEESAADGLRAEDAPVRLAAAAAVLTLTICFLVPGAGRPGAAASMLAWLAGAAATAAFALGLSAVARRVPSWVPAVAAGVGVVTCGAGL